MINNKLLSSTVPKLRSVGMAGKDGKQLFKECLPIYKDVLKLTLTVKEAVPLVHSAVISFEGYMIMYGL